MVLAPNRNIRANVAPALKTRYVGPDFNGAFIPDSQPEVDDETVCRIFDGGPEVLDEMFRTVKARVLGLASSTVDAQQGSSAALQRRLDRVALRSTATQARPWERLPELRRYAGFLAANGLNAYERTLRHLAADSPRLGIGPLRAVIPGAGDPHNGGRTVTVVSGLQREYFYKPRSLSLDAAFHRFVQRLFSESDSLRLESVYPFVAGGHGWVERVASQVDYANRTAAAGFYHRAGILIAVLYVLGATDMHSGNVIVTGNGPVVIDCETLLDPMLYSDLDDIAGRLMGIGLLPGSMTESAPNGEMVDFSAFHYRTRAVMSPRARLAVNPDSGELVRTHPMLHPLPYLPRVNGQVESPRAHAEGIVRGFEATMQLIIARKGEILDSYLADFEGCRVRVVMRDTSTYTTLADETSIDRCLSSSEERFAAIRDELASHDRLPEPVVWSELAQLSVGDVPYFTAMAGSTTLEARGFALEHYFTRSGTEIAAETVDRLTPAIVAEGARTLRAAFT